MREITLGQYYPADSVLHKLDPRVKLFGTLLFIISLFIVESIPGYIFAGRAVVILIIITVDFDLFLTPGEALVSFGIFTITREGVRFAIKMVVRLCFLILGSSIMTLTTTPNELTDGLEKGLSWLRVFKVPVHEIAMMMSIALSFIPILVEETDRIMKAQMARGADFESGNVIKKVKALVPLLVPLFVSAFRRANDLALAMEARCYHGGEGRTKMKPLVYTKRDRLAYAVLLLYLIAIILIRSLFG